MTENSEKTIPAGIRFRPTVLEALEEYAKEFYDRSIDRGRTSNSFVGSN